MSHRGGMDEVELVEHDDATSATSPVDPVDRARGVVRSVRGSFSTGSAGIGCWRC